MPRFFLVLMIGLLASYYYLQLVPAGCLEECAATHRGIIAHTAPSPYRYRLLSAWLVEPLAGDHSDFAIASAYIPAYFISLPVMLVLLYAWLRRWLKEMLALSGVLLVAVYLPMMFEVWGASLYTLIEIILLCAGLIILQSKPRFWTLWFSLVILISSVNRETAILLPLIFALTEIHHWRRVSYWLRSVWFGVLWLIVFVGLRLWLGAAPDTVPVADAWALNTQGGWWTWKAIFKNLFFLPIWLGYLFKIRHSPVFLKRLIPACLIYLALFLVFGFWNEVRLLLPLLVLTLPVSMNWLAQVGRVTVNRLQ